MGGGYHPSPEVVASWPKPSYVNPVCSGKGLLIVVLVFTVLAALAVGLRLWTRLFIQHRPGLDDLLIIFAMIPNVGIAGLLILVESKFCWFRHIWDVPRSQLAGRIYHAWIIELLFVLSTGFGKMSILFLYRRAISGVVNHKFIQLVNGAIFILVLYVIGFVLVVLLQCRPIRAIWLQFSYPVRYSEKFSCFDEGIVAMANACVSTATDFMTVIVPLFLFRQLHFPKPEKLALVLLFAVGLTLCVMGVFRITMAWHYFRGSYDVSWISNKIWSWTYAENCALMICASGPPLSALVKRLSGRSSSLPATRKSGTGSQFFSSIRFNIMHPSHNGASVAERRAPDEEEAIDLRTLQTVRQPHRWGWLRSGGLGHPSSKSHAAFPQEEGEPMKGIVKTVSFSQISDSGGERRGSRGSKVFQSINDWHEGGFKSIWGQRRP